VDCSHVPSRASATGEAALFTRKPEQRARGDGSQSCPHGSCGPAQGRPRAVPGPFSARFGSPTLDACRSPRARSCISASASPWARPQAPDGTRSSRPSGRFSTAPGKVSATPIPTWPKSSRTCSRPRRTPRRNAVMASAAGARGIGSLAAKRRTRATTVGRQRRRPAQPIGRRRPVRRWISAPCRWTDSGLGDDPAKSSVRLRACRGVSPARLAVSEIVASFGWTASLVSAFG
jgi:hypothetical protein